MPATQTGGVSSEAISIVYPLVAQSAAYTVQNGTTFLAGVTTVGLAGITVAAAQIVATQDVATWMPVITAMTETITEAAKATEAIATAAAKVLDSFPTG